MAQPAQTLCLQIVLVGPPAGVVFALQRGRDELIDAQLSNGGDIAFNLTVDVLLEDDVADFRGKFVQGPRGGRFVYVNAGELAGQSAPGWRRRAKIALGGIAASLIEACASTPSQALRAHIAGTAKDGGPPAATVPLIGGWDVVRV